MRTSLTLSMAIAVLATITGCNPGVAPNTAAVAVRTDAQPSEQDKTWLRGIHQANLTEVESGRLAMDKGTTKRIKAVGEMLVKDHAELDVKVTETASQLGVELPSSPSADQEALVARLEDASGEDFDQDFLSGMIKAHKEVLAATKTEVSGGSSPAVKSLAETAEASLKKHLAALKKAQRS
ncbi:DUF4142 domain-containing protein [Nonomuraea sp. MG754425]|uniref:DUF4142 domain-containing protein n=1 Tax=Nonomuraea sp. MG754425 TaxID=2570319 RepID=UPI001F36BC45|nr:DUF4142 domain-containing protein [Nonomuraea sp. MG754425]MCF6474713.1 DUF4142 domain-containing protein [Nonomuraea sp. MG754425]